jgi:hypothetical protein
MSRSPGKPKKREEKERNKSEPQREEKKVEKVVYK